MKAHPVGRRQFLAWAAGAVTGFGLAASILGGFPALLRPRAWAAELPPDMRLRATGFYEKTALEKETLVAVVFVPDGGTAPRIRKATDLEARDLGTAPMGSFEGLLSGMQWKIVLGGGKLRALVYSLATMEGDYAEEKSHLFGGSELDIENPRVRVEKRQGSQGGK
jgi:hypothetical protein